MDAFQHSKLDRASSIKLVANQQRRSVLQYLIQSPTDQATVDELVDYLVEESTSEPERVRIRLHHCDLPKLADHGVIDYDPRSGDVRYRPNDRIEVLLERFAPE